MIRAYIAVTAAYWGLMLADGALRMLVLLHFHTLGFSAVQLAYLFVLYEIAGIVTNLSAGWIAARFGLNSTLYAGLALQTLALLALAQLDPNLGITASVIFVMCVQGLSGVAKDLTKMSSKSAVKLLTPDDGKLFRLVAILTGSKNAVKGAGFLCGAALLALFGFAPTLYGMAAALFAVLIAVIAFMPPGLPQGRKNAKFTEVFSQSRHINILSAARLFLFGARDVWFVVGIPIYFYSVLSDGSPEGNRAAFFMIGVFMAVWTILYGAVQAAAPKMLKNSDPVRSAARRAAELGIVPAVLACAVALTPQANIILTIILVVGLLIFGALFAVNSALHSYLILRFSQNESVTMNVGFYYMANAAGRLVGTLLSGVTYQWGGLEAVLATASVFVFASAFTARALRT